jgi:phosphatidylinositol alpha-1,6-mannosyltransferase
LTLLGIEVWRPLRSSESLALSRATTRLAISHATLERAEPYLPRGIECEVLHLALEERKPAGEADARLLEQLAEGFLLIVGRMASEESYKGHDQLLEALSLVSSASEPPHLVIAGGGDDRERLESRARELGVRSRVTFTGHVSEATLAALYQRCCLFVMPSRGEGFGLVYLEAMRAGKPCIAARDTAAQEIVVDGLTGLLIGADQPTELARGIERLMADSATRRSFGEAGQQRYREQFSYERFEADLHRHLDRLTVLPSAPHTVAP